MCARGGGGIAGLAGGREGLRGLLFLGGEAAGGFLVGEVGEGLQGGEEVQKVRETGSEEERAEEAFGWWGWVCEVGGFACGWGGWRWVDEVGCNAAEPANCADRGCEADVGAAETGDEVAGHVFHCFFGFGQDGFYDCGVWVEE